jgi:hypothetical protein
VGTAGTMLAFQLPRDGETVELRSTGQPGRLSPHKDREIKWAGNQEAVTFLGYRPIRS